MRLTVFHAGLSLALVSGCAGRVQNGPLGPDHPASPSAAEAPLPPPPQTLTVDPAAAPRADAEGVVPPQVQQPGGQEHAATQGMSHDNMSRSGSGTQGTSAGRGGMSSTAPAGALYACPMHADVTSTNPNDRCPKCGMKINKPVKAAATAPAATPSGGNAPGQHQHDHGGGNK